MGEVVVNTGLKPSKGQITFDCEGNEGGTYHSRELHVPTSTSGLTIGRGYDMKERTQHTIISDLTLAGVSAEDAKKIAKAAHLSGKEAKNFITDNELGDFEISSDTQVKLFERAYQDAEKDVKRISRKADVVEAYGSTDWDALDPVIKDLLVDLRFRGDYTGSSRKSIQKHVADNDLEALAQDMSDTELWKNVPAERFKARKAMLDEAVRKKKDQEAKQVKLPPKP